MIKKDDVFEADDKLYVVLESINYNGHEYCLCNEMQDEKTFGATYRVFENFDDGIELVEDDDLLNKISPMFTVNLANDMYSSDDSTEE